MMNNNLYIILEVVYQLLVKASCAVVLGVLLVIVYVSQGVMNVACWIHSRAVPCVYRIYPKVAEIETKELLCRAKEVYHNYARS